MYPTDPMTGFLTKETIRVVTDKLQAEADRDNKPLTFLLLDMDHFRSYNEKFGHLEGDDMLKYFAGTLRASIPQQHIFAFRFGGDEFIIAFPEKTSEDVAVITRDILKIFEKRPYLMKGSLLKLHFSAGIATYPCDGSRMEDIIHKADKAMYYSKTHGRARVTIFKNMIRYNIARAVALIVVACAVIITALLIGEKNIIKRTGSNARKSAANAARKVMSLIGPGRSLSDADRESVASRRSVVYMKTGRTVKGTILRENDYEVELGLDIGVGKGSITVQRSNIDRIEREP